MSFFKKLFAPKPKGKAEYPNVKHNEDPFVMWEKTGELGDGAFGKVYKVCVTPTLLKWNSCIATSC